MSGRMIWKPAMCVPFWALTKSSAFRRIMWKKRLRAERHGADYLGVGAAFTTSSKPEAGHIDAETIRAICETVKIPVIAIGGIKEENLLQLRGNGLCGVAVISAIFAQKDIEAATRRLHALAEEMAGDQE